MTRIIAHLDMDAFFAAVEERDKPRLKGKPIVVGADPREGHGRGVVSTANYAARKYGIHSAMPISTAWRLAETARKKGEPEAVFIAPHGRRYGEVSVNIMEIVKKHVSKIEQVSVDEAYLDMSFTGSYAEAKKLARKLKKEISDRERLTASIGIGPNKLVAKIASDIEKPDGLTVVREKDAEKFLEPLSIRVIPGIGPKTQERFARSSVKTIRDLRRFSEEEIRNFLGTWGPVLYRSARGIDESPVKEIEEAKSVGEQETFEKDSRDPNFLTARLQALSAAVLRRFAREAFTSFGRVVLTVRFHDFETKTRSRTLEKPAYTQRALEFEALKLFMPFLDLRENPRRKAFRLLGVRVEKLS